MSNKIWDRVWDRLEDRLYARLYYRLELRLYYPSLQRMRNRKQEVMFYVD